jgi:hypothetical protein
MNDTSERPGNPGPVTVVRRDEQPYVGILRSVRPDGFAEVAHQVPVVIGRALGQGFELAGPPFFRYVGIDMAAESEVEVGVPVAATPRPSAPPSPEGGVRHGVLPSGHYATVLHLGSPAGLLDATRRLLAWAAGEGLEWDMSVVDGVERWGCRMESYRTDPRVEPDTAKWETELAFRLADLDQPGVHGGRLRP